MFSFSDILFLLVLFLLLFISVFLLTSPGRHKGNALIGLFFLSVCLNLTDGFLLLKRVYFEYPAWAGWGSCLLLTCGPLIFLYTQSVIYRDFRFNARKILHFLPFALLFLATETSYLLAGRDNQLLILTGVFTRQIPTAVYLASAIIYVHFLVYLFASLGILKKYALASGERFSNPEKVTVNWLRQMLLFFLGLMAVSAINSYLSFRSWQNAYFVMLTITVVLLLVFILASLFKALRHPGLFSGWDKATIDDAVRKTRYASSTVTDAEKTALLERLQTYMATARPYLDPELTLDQLARQLTVKPKTLSQVINEMLGRTFFEFINEYRITEAKRLLTRPPDKKITVLEVMYEVGFNSKSSFNTLFKKNTGLTPSEFKKRHLA